MLRSWRTSFWRFRLIWLLMLATVRRDSESERSLEPGKASRARHRCRVRAVDAAMGTFVGEIAARVVGTRSATRMGAVPPIERYRSFSIIAHIDHGKSTLADRILELCGAVDPRDMRAQYLDTMDLERERGITIKAQNVRLTWKDHVLQLIDTPGHVDFGYEVSRSLAACEGALLLVDASQGIEAQTLANCYAALEADLAIVAALNKIDLPAAEPDKRAEEIEKVLGIPADEILRISAKTGEGVAELLDAARGPGPAADRRPRRPAPGADVRLDLRPVPGRRQRRCGCSTGSSWRAASSTTCRPVRRTTPRRSGCAPPA